MDIGSPLSSEVSSLSFTFLTTEDVRAISVQKLDNPILLDNVNLPNRGGLYDPKLGPMSGKDICETCNLSYFQCPGHFGHIELPIPVFHPLFMQQAYAVLRGVCVYCHKYRMPEMMVRQYAARIKLLDAGLIEAAHTVGQQSAAGASRTRVDFDGEEQDEEEAEEIAAETAAEFVFRVESYTNAALANNRRHGGGQDDYKDGLVYEERKALLAEFVKSCVTWKNHAYTYRKEKAIKIIEYDLEHKKKLANQAMGLKRRNVLLDGAISRKAQKEFNEDLDEGIEMSSASSSSGSSSEAEEDNDGEEEDEEEGVAKVAKTASGQEKGKRGRNERVVSPAEVRAHLRLLFIKEAAMCELLYGRHGAPRGSAAHTPLADMFFLDVVPVAPTRFRPAARMGDDLFENSQNSLLTTVMQTSLRIQELNQKLHDYAKAEKDDEIDEDLAIAAKADSTRTFGQLLEAMITLQHDVNSFMDSSKNPAIMKQGKLPPQGVKQVLEKKEGLFRKHMMGKRVNYAARSVISPDINIETNEIGIPPVFAKRLTYPEPVTQVNVAELRQLVINGPKIHPGAAIVEMENGSQISLDRMTVEQRTALANQLLTPQTDAYGASSSFGPPAKNKKVYRHIRDGDIVILNRQPTLHKPSMMCHKVKILKGEKTIRMHYANCNSYNADFDGDEMNIHFPQNENARSEAYNIANTDNQYLVPTSGNPLRGLIQDHIVAGVWMCNKSTFFTREEYFQLIYGALRSEDNYTGGGRILTLPPAIWKPKPMWTGKQIFSTILHNMTPSNARGLNLNSKNKIQHNLWGRGKDVDPVMSEENVIFLDGHLICGVLDKSQYGASAFGLVHSVHELYGPVIANRLLSVLSRVLTKFLQHNAFSCRMDDLILTEEGEKVRKEILDRASGSGALTAIKYVGLPESSRIDDPATAKNLATRLEETLRDDSLMAGLDAAMQSTFNKTTSEINNVVLPAHLVRPFPDNNMQTMTISGAKGSKVNASQISTLLGQQALEGRRVPTMVSGKTLPSFKAFDTSARAGGYVANRFLTGIRPQEYYFHCMAGREGLIDTAVKTSRSGYLQRCLIKHLEGVKVHYDHTVRDSDSSVLQFLYGEDSLDVTKQKHLLDFNFAARNHESLIQKYDPRAIAERLIEDEAPDHMKKALKKPEKYPPALSLFSPSRWLGSMSEAYARKLNHWIDENKYGFIASKGKGKEKEAVKSAYVSEKEQVPKKAFLQASRMRYLRSLVEPGEAVGLLASQGVGEPSTQMTLNTFHLAGHGAANVTLGIPRLREIVMTASPNPTTPTMRLPLRETTADESTDAFIKEVSRLNLSQVIERVEVTEQLSPRSLESNGSRQRKYTVLLDFYPAAEYTAEYGITTRQVHESLAFSFAGRLKKEILVELRNASKAIAQDLSLGKGLKIRDNDLAEDEEAGEAPSRSKRRGADNELDEMDDDDGDAGEAKRKAQGRAPEYDADEPDQDLGDLENNVEDLMGDDNEVDDDLDIDPEQKAKDDAHADILLDAFKLGCKWASSFSFDTINGKSAQFELEFAANMPKLLLVDVVERCCRTSVIHEVENIGRCMRIYDDKGNFTMEFKGRLKPRTEMRGEMFPTPHAFLGRQIRRNLITEGSNLRGMWSMADEHVDLDMLGSNDISAILTTYGVEAARRAIIEEMGNVFGAYGIAVDYRHLTIIADYMTHAGGYRPFNRTGISHKSSPLLKASFETTVAFLSEATLHGDFDDLTSPAARIVMGLPGNSGTGSFVVRGPTKF